MHKLSKIRKSIKLHNYLKNLSLGSAAIGALSLSVLAPTQAGAQQLEEIIITAERRETVLQETPVAVSTFNSDELVRQGSTNLADVAAFTPNFQVNTRPGGGFAQGGLTIRGIGVDAGADASVGLYVDDVYYPSGSGNIIGSFDIERVEILRGPQGTNFGRNTIGGAVQYITKKPSFDSVNGEISASLGNLDRRDLMGAINIPLGETVAVRVSAGSQNLGGFIKDRLNNIDKGANKQRFARAQLRWEATDALTVDLKIDSLKTDINGRGTSIISYSSDAQFPQLAGQTHTPNMISLNNYEFVGTNAPDYSEIDFDTAQVNLTYDVNDSMTIRSITAYTETDVVQANDWDWTPLDILRVGDFSNTETWSQEFRLEGEAMNDSLTYTAGVYYFDSEDAGSSYFALGPVAPGWDTRFPGAINSVESQAIYGQLNYAFTDRVEGTVGVRYTDEEKNIAGVLPPTLDRSPATFTDTSPMVGVNFYVSDEIMTYAKASKGFRSGGLAFANSTGASNRYAPEEAWTYEFGARMEFMDRRLRVNPTVFFTDWEDIQFNELTPTPLGVSALTNNAGTASMQGLELELMFSVTENLLLTASGSYLDAEYDEVNNTVVGSIPNPVATGGFFGGPSLSVPNLCDGNDPAVVATPPGFTSQAVLDQYTCGLGTPISDLQRAPEFTYALGLIHDMPMSGGASLVSNINYTYTDNMRSAVTNLDYIDLPSYGLLGGRIQYNSPDGSWNAAIFGRNLLDEHYLIGGFDFQTTTGVLTNTPGRPREYGLTVGYNF
tara:strand:- start:88091 stop:90424 length:2334 start_codon:yes stop_codon:yes gene_type:complete